MSDYKLRFIPLGGVTDVTMNMYVYELYKKNEITDILIVDCGIGFPKEKDFGVDFAIPDISYLKDKKDKIRAVLFTHGHEDHITALRFHYEDLGRPPVYGSRLTMAFLQNKFREFSIPLAPNVVNYRQEYVFGDDNAFRVSFIAVTHSIPDTCHIFIKTPIGNFYHGSDFKFDLTPVQGPPPDFHAITSAGKAGVLCLLSDCLGSENNGLTASEKIVGASFEEEMRKTKGRFIMTTFSSNISRIQQCVNAAVKFNRKVCFLGRSMKENTEIAEKIGYLMIPKKFKIDDKDAKKYPPNKLCLIVAGSQGQYDSALSKISSKNNPFIQVEQGDVVMISSDPIPGQEEAVNNIIEQLTLLGVKVVYTDIHTELHASGHGNKEDLKFLVRFTQPKYLLPIGGTVRYQQQYKELMMDLGIHENRIILSRDRQSWWFEENKFYRGEEIDTKIVYIDAYGIGDVGNVVLRDRKTLSQEGIVTAIILIDNNKKPIGPVQFISRGFSYGKDEKNIFQKAEIVVESILDEYRTRPSGEGIQREILTELETFFRDETGRKPLVIVELIQT